MFILASNSPRRKQLLMLGGWKFQTLAPDVDESVLSDESPEDYVRRLAMLKANQAMNELIPEARKDAVIVSADTAVVVPNFTQEDSQEILGKPIDANDAERMLRQLRGRVHQVYTGLEILRAVDGCTLSEVVVADVLMRAYSDEEIRAYIASGDPLDKAGAYAIQHPIFRPVQNLQGCYANVMGLPVCHLARLLAEFDCPPSKDIPFECQKSLEYPCEIFSQVISQGNISSNTHALEL
jgi:nucleoside triphosphate pyrophosphatase